MNSIDVFNTETNEVEKTIPLNIAGFSTKFNPIKKSNMAIITNVIEKKYVVFDLENQKVLQINPIDVPISTITVLNQTEYSVDKTNKQNKKATESL